MIIRDFSIKRNNWELNGIHFTDVNLLVGPNAVGKSKTIDAIQLVADIISGRKNLQPGSVLIANITLEDGGIIYRYGFEIFSGIVKYEVLQIGNSTVIKRDTKSSSFYNDEVNPPVNRLLLGIRRDTQQYADIEKLVLFFENVSLFSFSSISPGERVLDPLMIGDKNIAAMFADLSDKERNTIIDYLNELDFKVGNLHLLKLVREPLLAMKEEGVRNEFLMWAFSTGLMRVVALLIYLYHLSLNRNGGLILIDDLGEGLDYYRSTKLGKFVCDFCKDKGIQIVLTTNDSFLMNVIDIDCWNVLSRKGSSVSAINIQTDPDLFNKFKLTGLSNYDFFRSDFIERNKRG